MTFDPLKNIYFDSSATTKIHPDVKNAMLPYLDGLYGNASSHYYLGQESKKAIEESRSVIAKAINCQPDEIYFTNGGTESDNWIIKGLKNKYAPYPMHMISTMIEHHAILESLRYRKNVMHDIDYVLVKPTHYGTIDVDTISNNIKPNTELISVMAVNNEIGTMQPISDIGKLCIDNNIIFHVDAVQAFGHMPINVKDLHIQSMSVSGHKFHGPKGVGFLYISNSIKDRFESLISGGQQEYGMRAGTENVAAIVGIGKATEIAMNNMDINEEREYKIRDYILGEIKQLDGIHINGSIEYMDPRHLNIRVDSCRGEELLALFNEQGICLSTGSACNSESGTPSHVLKAIGLSDVEANSSIRISIGADNTEEEARYFIECLKQNISILRGRL